MGAMALLLPFATDLLKKLFPDPQAQADAQIRLATLVQSGELAQLQSVTDLAKGQLLINQVEAGSDDNFTKRWRPFIGWVCGVALAWDTLLKPIIITVAAVAGHPVPPLPDLSTEQLYGVLFGLLGLGGLRTVEKVKK